MGRTKVIESPTLTFKAGGNNTPSPNKRSKKSTESSANNNNKEIPPISVIQPSSVVSTTEEENNKLLLPSVIQTGIAAKRSPLQIKNWIACVLTLDGRDKFTKVLQYSSRLLCWYFATLAARKSTTNGVGPAAQLTKSTMYTDVELRQQYYTAISKRFEVLYKSLVTSRKAFRIGRSVIEADKIANMGWGNYLSYMLLHPLAGGVAGADTSPGDNKLEEKRQESTLSRYDTHPIPEEDEDDEEASWNEEDEQSDNENDSPDEEKKEDAPNLPMTKSKKKKVVSRPDRPKLPTKISSNIGWGPATTSSSPQDASATTNKSSEQTATLKPPPLRTVSEMGRQMYQAFPSRSSSMGSYKQLKDMPSSLPMTPTQPTTPGWKLVGGTMKLLGLMGFWAFDNVSFLTGSGFLDPIRGNHNGGGDNTILVDPKASDRLKRKKRASEWAGRCYFAGSIGGLYVNARSLWEHRNGKLKEAQDLLSKATSEDDIKEAKDHLQKTKKKHFELGLALLKSCCDFMVFSNNPGIDLHMKYRGKKNHEGLHCLCGLVSASTVLYNNFPNPNA